MYFPAIAENKAAHHIGKAPPGSIGMACSNGQARVRGGANAAEPGQDFFLK
jgi:hypothetical protein